jgi:hypothetical protein
MRWLLTLCTFTLLFHVSSAGAQDRRESARADFQAGIASLEAGDFALAELSFRRSIAAYPTVAAQCNLALTYDRWGHHVTDALEAYERCADLDSSSSGHYHAHAVERAAELRVEMEAARRAPTEPASLPVDAGAPVLAPATNPPAQASRTMTYQQQPPTASPSRAFLWLGLTSTLVAGVAIASAAALAGSANGDADELERAGYPMVDGRYFIPEGDPGADTLNSAAAKASASIGLYVGGAILGALGVTFFIVQVATASGSADVAVAPREGGAVVSARLRL